MKIGTRESRLALIQTEMFISRLGGNHELVKIKSAGDMDRENPLRDIGGQGLFVNEINKNVLKGNIDCAVHSGKDLPSSIDENLEIVSVFDWTNYHDVILLNENSVESGEKKIGTSSPRRENQIKKYMPDCRALNLRGNIDTRLKRLDSGDFDGIILSEAAVKRMYPMREYGILPENVFVPAPCQGIIAVVARKDSPHIQQIKGTEEPMARKRWDMERCVSRIFDIGCSVPNGIFYNPENEMLYIDINGEDQTFTTQKRIRSMEDGETLAKQIKEILN